MVFVSHNVTRMTISKYTMEESADNVFAWTMVAGVMIHNDTTTSAGENLLVYLSLQVAHDGSPTLVVPWSGENLALADEVQPGEMTRPRRDKVLKFAKRKGLSKLEVFSTRVTDFEVRMCVDTLVYVRNVCCLHQKAASLSVVYSYLFTIRHAQVEDRCCL